MCGGEAKIDTEHGTSNEKTWRLWKMGESCDPNKEEVS